MMDELVSGINGLTEDISGFVSEQPVKAALIGVGVAGLTTGAVLGVRALVKKKKAKKKKAKTKKGRRRDRKFISKQKHERRRRKRPAKIYGKKGKYYSRKPLREAGTRKRVGKLYYTKKGQPYKIMASGKARFVKKTKGRKK